MSVSAKPTLSGSIFNLNYYDSSSSFQNMTVTNETVTGDEYVGGNSTVEGDLTVNGLLTLTTEPALISPSLSINSNQLTSKMYVDNLVNNKPYPQVFTGGNSVNSFTAIRPLRNFNFGLHWTDRKFVNVVDMELKTTIVYCDNTTSTYRSSIDNMAIYRFFFTANPANGNLNSVKYQLISGDTMLYTDATALSNGKGYISCGVLNNVGSFWIYFGNTPEISSRWVTEYAFSARIVGNFPNTLGNSGTAINAYLANFLSVNMN